MAKRLEELGPAAPTERELAAMQDAVGRAYDGWVQEFEDEIPWNPDPAATPEAGSDYDAGYAAVEATPEQAAELERRVAAGLEAIGG